METTLTERADWKEDFFRQSSRICRFGISNQCLKAGHTTYCSKDGGNVYINCPEYKSLLEQERGKQ